MNDAPEETGRPSGDVPDQLERAREAIEQHRQLDKGDDDAAFVEVLAARRALNRIVTLARREGLRRPMASGRTRWHDRATRVGRVPGSLWEPAQHRSADVGAGSSRGLRLRRLGQLGEHRHRRRVRRGIVRRGGGLFRHARASARRGRRRGSASAACRRNPLPGSNVHRVQGSYGTGGPTPTTASGNSSVRAPGSLQARPACTAHINRPAKWARNRGFDV